jgi:HSP20 family protein
MTLTDLIPWARARALAPRFGDEADPFLALHRDMSRLLDNFTRGFGLPAATTDAWSAGWPTVEVSETANEIKVVAELPGLEEKDVELSLRDGVLTLQGEKSASKDGAVYSERWHGKFQRAIPVGPAIDPENVAASFKNGVLSVTLGKRDEARTQVKRIPIGAA